MVEKIDISVVTYNSEKWIPIFMESLLRQNYPISEINLFFSDNGSKDDTLNSLCKYEKSHGKKFSTFKIFKRENDGFGAGHNYNIKLGSSRFVLVTNLDLEFEDNAIVNAVQEATDDLENVASWEFLQKPYEHPKDYNPVTREVSWSSSACILFRRDVFLQIGGYEERIFMYGEDVEISYRLRDHGYTLKYVPNAICWHYAYEHKNQVKKIQLYGSLETNLCLRIRYGSTKDIFSGIFMYLGLFFIKTGFENHKTELIKHLKIVLKNFSYYHRTRKKSDVDFKFILWDYEERRDGAFYEFTREMENREHPKASVIIRTYAGRLELLKQAVESVLAQTYRYIEIIVVEDGSNDSKEYIEKVAKLNSNREFRYESMPKLGRCVSGNRGLEIATGEYLCFLDDDDLLYADHIEVLFNHLVENPELSAAYSSSFEVPSKIISLNPLKIIENNRQIFYRQEFSRFLLWSQNYIPIQSILFKRQLYENYGGFDLTLDNLEDWNLWTRYSAKNEFGFVEKTTSMYRVPMDSQVQVTRQKKMNEYYQLAIEKQTNIMATASITDIRAFAEEYARNRGFRRKLVRKLANTMRKNKFTAKLFVVLRKVYFKMKK